MNTQTTHATTNSERWKQKGCTDDMEGEFKLTTNRGCSLYGGSDSLDNTDTLGD
jgi:hypothetical protein